MRTTEDNFKVFGFNKILKDVDIECFDEKLPEPFECDIKCKNLLSLGKIHKKGDNNNVLYKFTYDNIKILFEAGLEQKMMKKVYNITSYIDTNFTQIFDNMTDNTKYAVKAILAPTYRDMIRGLKEAYINQEMYIGVQNVNCSLMICKPFFCMPYWNGEKWFFLIATEFAKGTRLSEMMTIKLFSSVKETVRKTVNDAINTLWWCGYSHTNISKKHIIYNKKDNTVKFVGLSHCVAIPYKLVECFRHNLTNCETSFEEQFEIVFREESLRLSALADTFGKNFQEETEASDFIISTQVF